MVSANAFAGRDGVADLGAFRVICVIIRVIRAGTANDANTTVRLQHAAVNEEDGWVDLAGTTVRVDTAAPQVAVFFEVPAFARYVRWATGSGSFVGNPVVLIDLVGKE